ncbi:MAG: Sec-independent protein translocase subunit TatA/TatB [Planctomycetota bacterium]|jgi:sec-independent protein translocase protein TatA
MVFAFIAGLGVWEVLVILAVALIVFGPRLPEVAKSIGKGYLEFRRGLRSFESDFDLHDADIDVSDPPKPRDPDPPGKEDDREAPEKTDDPKTLDEEEDKP